MDEIKKECNVILDKKMDHYNFKEQNFVAPGEITVTITLDEYRELVKSKAEFDRKSYEFLEEKTKLKEIISDKDETIKNLLEQIATLGTVKVECAVKENNANEI